MSINATAVSFRRAFLKDVCNSEICLEKTLFLIKSAYINYVIPKIFNFQGDSGRGPSSRDERDFSGKQTPMIKRPSPVAIQIIEKFLLEKKLRLIDLFQSADKNKDWKVTREEFRHIIKQVRSD